MDAKELSQKFTDIGLEGWLDLTELEVLMNEAKKLPAGAVYFEVGVAYGKSMATVRLNSLPEVQVWGVDILDWIQRKEKHEKLGIFGAVNFIKGDSQEVALNWDRPIDLLFIDSDHSYLGVLKDICSWIPHVKSEGRIIFHDYDRPTSPGVCQAVDEFVRYSHRFKEVSIVTSMLCITKK